MLLCFLHFAGRRNEIFNLKGSDIDFPAGKVRLFTRKRRDRSNHYDWLPMTNSIQVELLQLQDMKKEEYVFINPKTDTAFVYRQKWMPRICAAAEVTPFGLHAIRHLSASILVENDVPLVDIKTILRHKNISTTERYLHRLKSVRKSIQFLDI